jgi:hypothetical protein
MATQQQAPVRYTQLSALYANLAAAEAAAAVQGTNLALNS